MSNPKKPWRESIIDINNVKFKKIKLDKVISYPPAGNDVFECIGEYNNQNMTFIIKSERGKFANFENEIKVLKSFEKKLPVPSILESGTNEKLVYIVLSKIQGKKLSEISKYTKDLKPYLFEYGRTLSKIHNMDLIWEKARQRDINDFPDKTQYKNLTSWENKIIDYPKETKPLKIKMNTFIHGDFHYGNILWKNKKITGILDWEYAGTGFKEQDIAWALVLRPTQNFLKTKEEISIFLEGYKKIGTYDVFKLKWCLINGYMHFYLMNREKNDTIYLKNLKKLIELFMKNDIENINALN